MKFLTQRELKEIMLLSYEKIKRNKEEINKINVFPVPDQDTGDNMVHTLLGVKTAVEQKEFKDLDELSENILDGALTGAQGNAGVIYTGFLAGFLPALQNKNPIDAGKLAGAFLKGAERARASIQNPQEGTILDVIDAAAQTFEKESKKETDIAKLFKKAVGKANEALLATREKMEIFRKANVVDAGGLAYLIILEGHLEVLEGEKRKKEKEEKPSEKVRRFVQTLSHRYEVVFLVKNERLDRDNLEKRLTKLGNSLEVLKIGDRTKVHIHTDLPDEVKQIARDSGQLQSLRIEDMAKEVAGEESIRTVSIGIVTEDIAMLLPKIVEKYQIEIVPARYNWPEEKDLPGENIYQKMREADKRGIETFPKTSQATPKSYLDAFEKQLQKFDKVLCITASSKISGCYNSAKQAELMVKESQRVFILDSLNVAAGEALLVLRAVELIQEQREIAEVIDELKNLISQIHLYIMFEDPKWVEVLGRITKSQANWIRRMKKLRFHPMMELKNGMIAKGGIVFAKDAGEVLFKKVLKESKNVRKKSKRIRVIIGHADNLREAEKLKKILKEEIAAEVPYISLGPTVICAAAGPGTLFVAWQAI